MTRQFKKNGIICWHFFLNTYKLRHGFSEWWRGNRIPLFCILFVTKQKIQYFQSTKGIVPQGVRFLWWWLVSILSTKWDGVWTLHRDPKVFLQDAIHQDGYRWSSSYSHKSNGGTWKPAKDHFKRMSGMKLSQVWGAYCRDHVKSTQEVRFIYWFFSPSKLSNHKIRKI